MNLYKAIKTRLEKAPNRLALAILIWCAKEPSDERLLPSSALREVPEGDLRHKIRAPGDGVREEKIA